MADPGNVDPSNDPSDLLRTAFKPEAFSYYERLGRVRRFVLDNCDETIELAEVAGVAHMERTAFSDFFHRKTGVCFRDWLTAIRVARAMEIMAERNVPVRTVADKVGYAGVRTFERAFLRVTGRTPIAYKNSVRPS